MIFLFGRGVPNETKGMINLNNMKKKAALLCHHTKTSSMQPTKMTKVWVDLWPECCLSQNNTISNEINSFGLTMLLFTILHVHLYHTKHYDFCIPNINDAYFL